jgi:hypothetical protein
MSNGWSINMTGGLSTEACSFYADRSEEYLVVEADTTILGHDGKYVLSNFCPSVTPNLDALPIGRYKRGRAFLRDKADTSLRFCTAVMDTMHECRFW